MGYIYQCEYALFRALDTDDPAEGFMVETFDDVVVEGEGDAFELLQLKHHDPAKAKAFTDKSSDLWKTIRIWSSLVRDNAVDPSKTSFFLLTTAQASSSAMLVDYLAPKGGTGGTRNVTAAKALLMEIAEEIEAGTTDSMKKNVEPFLALPEATRGVLIGNMTIVPGVAVIESLRQKIIKRLSLTGATTGNLERLAQSLVGWWYWVLIERLRAKEKVAISKELLQEKITDLVSQYVVSSLPIFEDITNPDADQKARLLQRLFVRQLMAIGHAPDKTAVAGALLDVYKADGHIKRWLESLRLQPKELQEFKDQLYGHWAAKFGAIEPDADACLGRDDAESELAKLGRAALSGSLSGSQAKLKDVEIDYLRRGVLHLMANDPVIGWHPHWVAKFKSVE
ncbi:ABC-three component system protein [Microvirga vignae]|nr:ABC-three component system protein [Microvirga vignae]